MLGVEADVIFGERADKEVSDVVESMVDQLSRRSIRVKAAHE